MISIKVAEIVVAIALLVGAFFYIKHIGVEEATLKMEEAQQVQLKKDAKAVEELRRQQVQATNVMRQREKVVEQSNDECLKRNLPTDVDKQLLDSTNPTK